MPWRPSSELLQLSKCCSIHSLCVQMSNVHHLMDHHWQLRTEMLVTRLPNTAALTADLDIGSVPLLLSFLFFLTDIER